MWLARNNWPVYLQRTLLSLTVIVAIYAVYSGEPLFLYGYGVVIAMSLALIWSFTNLQALTAVAILIIPLSVKVSLGSVVISLPAEAMMAGLAAIFLFRAITYPSLDRRILFHPISVLLCIELLWMMISSAFSTMPEISLKRTAVRFLYLAVLFLMLAHWFKKPANRPLFFLLLIAGCIPPAINTIINHAELDFNFHDAYLVTLPFFDDHTIYGAFLAFLLPFAVIAFVKPRLFGLPPFTSLMLLPVVVFLLLAEYLSFSRAAWLSLAGSGLFFLVIMFRISFRAIVMVVLIGSIVVISQFDMLYSYAKQNEAVSNTNDLSQQLRSVTNVSTDNSNLERINRWKCAWRMSKAKPVTGFGPGTYQFQYGPFQIPVEKTYLGTYNGDKGNAHSDYLTALAENGWPGAILMLTWVGVSLFYGLRIIYRTNNPQTKWMAISVVLGLFTFYLHGWVNTFLDQVKMATVVFGALAMLTALHQALQQEKK